MLGFDAEAMANGHGSFIHDADGDGKPLFGHGVCDGFVIVEYAEVAGQCFEAGIPLDADALVVDNGIETKLVAVGGAWTGLEQ
jgi:hypothetical protein